jgi:hypothetical protein
MSVQQVLSAAELPINGNLKFVGITGLFSKIVAQLARFVRLFAWEVHIVQSYCSDNGTVFVDPVPGSLQSIV